MRQADVAVEGAELYEKYLLARDLERFLDDTDHMLVRSIEQTEDHLAAHAADVSQHDLLRLKTARGPLIVGLHQAQAGTRQAAAGLRAYFGLRDGIAFEPADERLEAIPTGQLALAELVRRAHGDRPELVALADGAAAFDALARAERSGYLPDLVAIGFVSGAYTVGRDAGGEPVRLRPGPPLRSRGRTRVALGAVGRPRRCARRGAARPGRRAAAPRELGADRAARRTSPTPTRSSSARGPISRRWRRRRRRRRSGWCAPTPTTRPGWWTRSC